LPRTRQLRFVPVRGRRRNDLYDLSHLEARVVRGGDRGRRRLHRVRGHRGRGCRVIGATTARGENEDGEPPRQPVRTPSRGGWVVCRALAALPCHTKSFGRRCEVLKAPRRFAQRSQAEVVGSAPKRCPATLAFAIVRGIRDSGRRSCIRAHSHSNRVSAVSVFVATARPRLRTLRGGV
jgi:hypothetical protein